MIEKNKKFTCVALVARKHGLETIKRLIGSSNFEIVGIFTHRLNPKVYDVNRNERKDFKDFKKLAEENKISFFTVDKSDEKFRLGNFVIKNEFDFLISISWRYIIPSKIFKKAKYGSINIHRGDLPKYAGIEPIRRALENSEKEIVISCHHISEEIDAGEIIFRQMHPTKINQNLSIEENVERLKEEITQYFPELTIKSLEFLRRERKNEK